MHRSGEFNCKNTSIVEETYSNVSKLALQHISGYAVPQNSFSQRLLQLFPVMA